MGKWLCICGEPQSDIYNGYEAYIIPSQKYYEDDCVNEENRFSHRYMSECQKCGALCIGKPDKSLIFYQPSNRQYNEITQKWEGFDGPE